MYCESCETLLRERAQFCPRCGRPAPGFSSNNVSYEPALLADPRRTSQEGSASSAYERQNPSTPISTFAASSNAHSVPPTPPLDPNLSSQADSPVSDPPSSIPAGPPAQKAPRRLPKSLTILILVLVLLLVGAGLLIYYANVYQPNLRYTQATATVVTQMTSTVLAVENPYTHIGKLILTDSLQSNSKSKNWDVNGNCAFKGTTYHAIAPNQQFSDYCIANGTNFSNFAFEASMKIIRGDAGGVLFRVENTNPNQYYDYYVGQDGTYGLEVVNVSHTSTLIQGTSAAINQGLYQENLVGVVARGNTLMLYVNHQYLGTVTDPTFSHGQIGVYAVVYTHPTEVVFSNLRLWTL
jgi:hypothetical protein